MRVVPLYSATLVLAISSAQALHVSVQAWVVTRLAYAAAPAQVQAAAQAGARASVAARAGMARDALAS